MKRHFIIPDRQARPGVPLDHNLWLGKAIAKYRPDVLIDLGDNADFPSVSTHSLPGSLEKEGQRLSKDIESAQEADRILFDGMGAFRPKRMVRLRGNHEDRLDRYLRANPVLEGIISLDLLKDSEWEVVPFSNGAPGVIDIDGIHYAHYFASPNTGRPIGGTATYKLAAIGSPFVMGHVQGYDIGTRQYATGRVIRGIVAGSCLTPDHKVLTADLRYVPLGDVVAGDQLVSFDEDAPQDGKRSRRFKTGTVEAVKLDEDEVFAVTLSTGKVFKVTADHLWLARKGGTGAAWIRTDQMKPEGAHPNGKTHVPILFDEWEGGTNFEHGWLSGMYDGEGCLYARETTGGHSMQLTLHQKQGAVMERAKAYMADLFGLELLAHTAQKRDVAGLTIKGGRRGIARVLGTLRPIRLLAKFRPELLSRIHMKEFAHVVKIEPLGRQQIVRIAIDAKTMIVEGYGHHNCYLHDEPYKGAANAHDRCAVVLNEVRNGRFSEMPLTLDYLCREYEGTSLARFLQRKYRRAKDRFSLARVKA
jgi:hypothetical protein